MNSIPILYENEEIIVINKPSGLAVQGGQGITHSIDVDFSKELGYKIYLVHRLDKDTAGLMLIAKTPKAANKWTKLIAGKEAHKEYIAICAGSLKNKEGWIKESLVQHGIEKSASTFYRVEKEWDVSVDNPMEGQPESIKMSQIRLKLDTGRMHQIRIHLSKQGCPIAGDDQHGNFKINKILKKQIKIKKLLLASVRLSLPINNKEMTFEIPLPDYMQF